MTTDWNIQPPAEACADTGRAFAQGETVYSALYWQQGRYLRQDRSAAAWSARAPEDAPLCAWQFEFSPPPVEAKPDPLPRDRAEARLRELMAHNDPDTRNTRYILALLLERKRLLRPIERQAREDGAAVLVYEHAPTRELWLIEDPGVRLDQLPRLQEEVAGLLAGV